MRKKFTISREYIAAAAIIVWVCYSWLWILQNKVSELAGQDSPAITVSLSVIVFSVLVSVSAAIFGLFLWSCLKLYRRPSIPAVVLVLYIFFGWAVAEFLASWIPTLIWYGTQGSWDSVLPFSSLTPIITYTPIRFASRLVGYYGLSALVVTVFACLYVKRLRSMLPFVMGAALTLSFVGWLAYRQPSSDSQTIKAGVVQESVYQERLPQFDTDADLLMFPEYAFSNELDPSARFTSSSKTYFVGSQHEGKYNVLVFGSNHDGIKERHVKSRLIPGGEYMPYAIEALLKVARKTDVIEFFNDTRATVKGPPNYQSLVIDQNIRLGSAVCASIISPEDYRKFTQSGATILTNSASLNIFSGGLFAARQEGLARFMATANARPFLQSSADGSSLILDHNGNVLARSDQMGVTYAEVRSNATRTVYSRLGEWTVLLGIPFITYCLITCKRKQKIY